MYQRLKLYYFLEFKWLLLIIILLSSLNPYLQLALIELSFILDHTIFLCNIVLKFSARPFPPSSATHKCFLQVLTFVYFVLFGHMLM